MNPLQGKEEEEEEGDHDDDYLRRREGAGENCPLQRMLSMLQWQIKLLRRRASVHVCNQRRAVGSGEVRPRAALFRVTEDLVDVANVSTVYGLKWIATLK